MTDFTAQTMHQLIGHEHGIVLEGGCNEFDDTERFVREMPSATFHCFDCDSRAIAKGKAKNLPPNVHLYEVALAEITGQREFHPSDGKPDGDYWREYGDHWDKSGSLLPFHKHLSLTPWMRELPPITVPTITLDDWAEKTLAPEDVVDFGWFDLQGYEGKMLQGAQQTIRRLRWFYAECDPRPLYYGMAKLHELDALLPGFTRQPVEYRGFNFLWKNDAL